MSKPYRRHEETGPIRDFMDPIAVGMVKIRDRGNILSEATLLGSGTFVHLAGRHGILTAAHVMDLIEEGPIGLVLFDRAKPHGQFKIEVRKEDFFYSATWKAKGLFDLGFPEIADESRVADLKALGRVFYNLDKDRKDVIVAGERLGGELWLLGVVDESREVTRDANDVPFTGFQMIYGGVSTATEDGNFLIEVHLSHSEIGPPTGYGGVSGGGLWAVVPEADWFHKMLVGVAFEQSAPNDQGDRSISCHSLGAIAAALLPAVPRR